LYLSFAYFAFAKVAFFYSIQKKGRTCGQKQSKLRPWPTKPNKMDINQARILIRKIDSLFKSMEMDGSPQPTPIERDLMLSYLRQLYQAFLDEGVEPQAITVAAPKVAPPPVSAPPIEPVKPVVAAPVVETPAPPPAPKPAPQPEPKPAPAPPPIEVKEVPLPTPEPEPNPIAAPTPQAPPQPEPKPAPALSKSGNAAFDKLFSSKKATEVSEKLGESPIADLNRALSINDRLMYMSELFGRNMKELEAVLNMLNQMPNLDSAKAYLFTFAEQYKWMQGERLETAETFIKLIRRRYL
jgi:hypothetical protein